MPAPASIAAAWRSPSTSKDGSIVGYFGKSTKGESPNLTFPNGLDPQEHIFGVDRVTSDPLYLVRDPIEVLKAFEAGMRQRRLLPHRGHRRDPARSACIPDGRAQMRVAFVLLNASSPAICGARFLCVPVLTESDG